MKQILSILVLTLCACSSNNDINLTGRWMEVLPQGVSYVQGMDLKEDGSAESVGMGTLLYHQWSVTDNKLILNGESIGNGQTVRFSDTMRIVRCNVDTLVVERNDRNIVFIKDNDISEAVNNCPARKAYDGFTWRQLSGAGLTLWVQENENIRLLADPSLPGISMVRKGDKTPHRLIQVFNLPNKDINDVIMTLETSPDWDRQQACKFEETKSMKKGVRKFVMVPDGDYAVAINKKMQSEPVPVTCCGWGVGNSGKRYFEIHDSNPDKAIFLEIGQDAPLFDENSISFSGSANSPLNKEISKDELFTLKGTLTIGHEVRSFKPEGSNDEYWIVDKTDSLNDIYDKASKGHKNGKPMQAVLKVEYNGKWEDGFAADYSGVFFVREVICIK